MARPAPIDAFREMNSGLRVTDLKVFVFP